MGPMGLAMRWKGQREGEVVGGVGLGGVVWVMGVGGRVVDGGGGDKVGRVLIGIVGFLVQYAGGIFVKSGFLVLAAVWASWI